MVGLVLLCALVSQVRAEYSQSEEENQTETADEPEERVDAGTPAPPTPAPAPTPPPPTPAPAPRPPVERKPANDVNNARQSHGEHVRQLQMTNVEFRVGIWLYGDYTD